MITAQVYGSFVDHLPSVLPLLVLAVVLLRCSRRSGGPHAITGAPQSSATRGVRRAVEEPEPGTTAVDGHPRPRPNGGEHSRPPQSRRRRRELVVIDGVTFERPR